VKFESIEKISRKSKIPKDNDDKHGYLVKNE